jgi:MerR family transcriptional regulator, thiopeptide resistance regulator
MFLKVGELAKRTGLTVRTLHHYDNIGLLSPSGRSEGGYRLYGRDDVARLHGIQTLRRLGLSLGDVAQLLDGGAVSLPAILGQQISALDQQIVHAEALRERLGVLQLVLAFGGQPEIDDWLTGLSMMSTFEQYFNAAELKLVFERWRRSEAEWPPLLRSIRDAMQRGVPHDSIEAQQLARRWAEVTSRWMNGDLALLKRWRRMLQEQPSLPLPHGMDRASLEYIGQAIQLRLGLLAKYVGADDLQRIDFTLDPQWRALGERAEHLMAAGVLPDSADARHLGREWQALLDQMVRHDASLRARLLAAYENEPLLQASSAFSPQALHYMGLIRGS